MKRYLSFFLAVLLTFSLTACAADPADRQLTLSQTSLSGLQEEHRLSEKEDKLSSRVPDKQDTPDEDENLAASLKDRISGNAVTDKGSSAPSDAKGTPGQSDTAQTSKQETEPENEPEPEPENEPEPQSVTVYITKTGKKYHRSGCQYLKKSKIETTLSSAKARGYTACSKCKP